MIDKKGYIKLTDFGLSKIGMDRTYSLCGTPEYIAPEVLTMRGHNKMVDYWTLGCLVYEMLANAPPFQSKTENILFNLIKQGKYSFPNYFSDSAKKFISALLVVNVSLLSRFTLPSNFKSIGVNNLA